MSLLHFARRYGLLAVLVAAQLAFWYETRHRLPDMTIVPNVPAREVIKALSLGDEQFYFRHLALEIQNAGDTFGRFTPLREYDYNKLAEWFRLLDVLDNVSDFIPTLATYYYSQTQNTPDVRYIVDYLYDHAASRPSEHRKWWWLIQAVYLANHKLEDKELALKVGQPLVDAKGIPLWARQYASFIYEQMGEAEQALFIIEQVLKDFEEEKLSQEDFNFMKYFIEERLEKALPGYFDSLAPATEREGNFGVEEQ